jgi:hypothetical protein
LTYQEALAKHGTKAEAARQMGLPVNTFKHRLETELAGRAVTTKGERVVGRSTLTDAEGNVVLEWTKTAEDKARADEAMRATAAAMADKLPRAAPVRTPVRTSADLCNLYTFTDYHLGMLAWGEEAGDDWDLKIAEKTLLGGFRAMIDQSPSAHTAVINIQGDFLHTDGLLPITPAHHHVLDADGRFSKIVAVAIRSIRALVAMALAKHTAVHLIIAEGNHDEASSVWLRLMFTALYDQEPRVEVNASELPFYAFQWGKTMLGFHHGHKVKNEALPLLFAAQFPEMWGQTKRRAIHCGHRHHTDEKEYNGVTVVQHPTLAARDAYAARGGWIADRAAQSITYHREYGQVGRVFVCPEMLAA